VETLSKQPNNKVSSKSYSYKLSTGEQMAFKAMILLGVMEYTCNSIWGGRDRRITSVKPVRATK
jgi:hypothetical protein